MERLGHKRSRVPSASRARKSLLWMVVLALVSLGHAQGDIVHMKDGRKIEGKVLKKTSAEVTLSTQFGELKLRRTDIERIEVKETPLDQYRSRLKGIEKDDVNALFDLAMWCKEEKLNRQYKDLLKQVLEIRPQHDGANEEQGNVRYQDEWFTKEGLLEHRKEEEKSNREKGLVVHEGKWMTPDEKMTSQGYVKVGEEWVSASEADRLDSKRQLEEVLGYPINITNTPHFSVRSTDDEEQHKQILAMCEDLYGHFIDVFKPNETERKIIDFVPVSIYVLDDMKACETWIASEYYRRYKPPKNTIQRYKDASNFSYYFPRPVIVIAKGRHLKGGGDRDTSLRGFISHHVGNVLIRRFKRGGKIPGWLEAGMAAYIEGRGNGLRTLSISEYEGYEHIRKWAGGYEDFRQWFSSIAKQPEALPKLSLLMDRPLEEIDSREICKAFSLCEYFIENHAEAFVEFSRRSLAPEKDETISATRAFEEAFGSSMNSMDALWLAWAKEQSPDRGPPRGGGFGLGAGGD